MDGSFPKQLFPHFYLDGPPETKPKSNYAGWGSYERVFDSCAELGDAEGDVQHRFESQHTVRGDQWVPIKPAVTPLFPPCEDAKVLSGPPPDPMDFAEHMQYFYQHHCMDAFSTMGHLLQDDYSFNRNQAEGVVNVSWYRKYLERMNYKRCHVGRYTRKIRRVHHLLADIVCDIPSSVLGKLLHEELTSQREQQQFCSDFTGGALGYTKLFETQAGGGDGCLIFPSGPALNNLNFHRVVPKYKADKPPSFLIDPKPLTFEVNGTIKQLSLGNMEDKGNLAVRSDFFCGVWLLGDRLKPYTQEVIQTKDRFSCVTVSPHIPDELVVANERGAAYLWTVKKGLQKFREEDANLYFNAKSPWRWCEFSCHPRVMVFADRTGAELADARNRDCYHTLFRIGKTPACVTGERVMLTKYLSESHAHHHLITTQFSAYLMDERVPCVPMLKWDHMMESPPVFACALPGPTQNDCKVLLGAQKSQEIMLLQYKGGREHACQTRGPIQKLFSPNESLDHVKLLLPHKRHLAQKRLSVPAAGLAAVQNKDYMSLFQLTETGDIFYQTLKLHKHQANTSENLKEPASSSANVGETGATSKDIQSAISNVDDDSDSEAHQSEIGQLDKNQSHALDTNKDAEEASMRKNHKSKKDRGFQDAWDQWLNPIFQKAASKKQHFRHQQIKTKDIMDFRIIASDKLEEDRLESLRGSLHNVMRKKEPVLHWLTYLPHLKVTPVPDPVDPAQWPDDLSQRLTAAWEGEWKNWWEEKLGLNRNEKIAALRRKRRREKQARAGSRVSLFGSFTSSMSCQGDLSGWSSAASLCSDGEALENSQAMEEVDVRSETEMEQNCKTTVNDQQSIKSARRSPPKPKTQESLSASLSNDQPTTQNQKSAKMPDLGVSTSVSLPRSPTRQSKRLKVELSSIFGSQKLESVSDGGVSFSQVSSSSSQRFSQVRTPTRGSQPKKKSRMGF